MELIMINNLIDKFTQRSTIELTKGVRNLVVFSFILSSCLLLTLKSYKFTGILFLLLIGEFVYLTVILKKKKLTIYSGIGVSFILCGQLALMFNVSLYSIQKINGFFNPISQIVILLIEVLCLICGFLYTNRCVKKGKVRKPKTAAIASTSFVLPGAIGYFFSRYISDESSVHMQSVIFTIMFTMVCSMIIFVLGMGHIAIIYYIKKYNISDRAISKVD